MSRPIQITAGDVQLRAELNDSDTSQAIYDALPIAAAGNRWGEEIYFEIPVQAGGENGREVVSKGDLGYWPTGNAFCIFFGKTPMSESEEEIRPASAVNPIGRIENADALKKHSGGEPVRISLAE